MKFSLIQLMIYKLAVYSVITSSLILMKRRRFAQVSHEYLIEQLQFSSSLNVKNGDNQAELDSITLLKKLQWVANPATAAINHNFEHNNIGELTVNSALLQLNGHDRFRKRDGSYFAHVQTYQHHKP